MGIEKQIDKLIDFGEDIKTRLDRLIELATDHFADANKMVSEETEYREPVLPADVGEPCEFSVTGNDWYESLLAGFQAHNNPWISSDQGRWKYARIKKDA